MHAFENQSAIVAPLISIAQVDEISDAGPIFSFGLTNKVFSVTIHLALRLPQPEIKQSQEKANAQPKIKSAAETGHSPPYPAVSAVKTPEIYEFCGIMPTLNKY